MTNQMKIKRIHTSVALLSKQYKFMFDSSEHKLDYDAAMQVFIIDGDTLIPISNVREVLLEKLDQSESKVDRSAAQGVDEPEAQIPLNETEAALNSTQMVSGLPVLPEPVKRRRKPVKTA